MYDELNNILSSAKNQPAALSPHLMHSLKFLLCEVSFILVSCSPSVSLLLVAVFLLLCLPAAALLASLTFCIVLLNRTAHGVSHFLQDSVVKDKVDLCKLVTVTHTQKQGALLYRNKMAVFAPLIFNHNVSFNIQP